MLDVGWNVLSRFKHYIQHPTLKKLYSKRVQHSTSNKNVGCWMFDVGPVCARLKIGCPLTFVNLVKQLHRDIKACFIVNGSLSWYCSGQRTEKIKVAFLHQQCFQSILLCSYQTPFKTARQVFSWDSVQAARYFNRRNFRERNIREFREFWPFSRKFVSRKFSKWQFAKVYPVKFFWNTNSRKFIQWYFDLGIISRHTHFFIRNQPIRNVRLRFAKKIKIC